MLYWEIFGFKKFFLRLEVHGAENIPKTGPLVIASNHLSLLDPPVIGVAAPRKVHFMAKRELFCAGARLHFIKLLARFRLTAAARTGQQ